MSREFTPETERQRLQFLVRKTFLLTSFLLNHLPGPSQPPMLPAGLPSWWAPRGRGQPHSWDMLMALVHPSQLAGLGRGTGMRGAAPAHWRGGISCLVEPWFAAGSAGDPGLSAWGRFGAVAWRRFSPSCPAPAWGTGSTACRCCGSTRLACAVTRRSVALLPPPVVLPRTVEGAAALAPSPSFFPGCSLGRQGADVC